MELAEIVKYLDEHLKVSIELDQIEGACAIDIKLSIGDMVISEDSDLIYFD